MKQTLLIGLGGTGSRVVNNVVKELHLNKKEINNGEICCAVLDTNVNDADEIVRSSTGVPVIPTSKAQKIRGYFEEYNHLHIGEWCPQSPSFMEESMLNGASELRVKSRLAFMDCIESGKIDELEFMINDVLKNNEGSQIRIMIVSSLSGGTGSGMFIQVALWLRKILCNSQITIRGIFMLPDVFVSNIKDIKDNKTTSVRHYCNAYAAIRELNAITNIREFGEGKLAEKITIGNLFDSEKDFKTGKPVYDFAFFIDDKDENGVRLESVAEYEKMVAQLVYMQLYAPMSDDMYSEEDNAFIAFKAEKEMPLYGSCGTAKAVYPTESVKNYCALRAAQDSLTSGWNKIDSEINAILEEKKRKERDGIYSNEVIDVRAKFMKIFEDKTAVKAEEVAEDRFFINIAKDVKNEVRRKEGEKTVTDYRDKVSDFVKLLQDQKIDPVVVSFGIEEEFAIDSESFVDDDHTMDELRNQIKNDEVGISEALDKFDKNVADYADTIVNSVFPYSMGDVKPENRATIYGLLSKPNDMGELEFIHPVAARYVLYKLIANLERAVKGFVLADRRAEALAGGDVGTLFDNKRTAETEATPEAFLNSKKFLQNEAKFLDDFEGRYAQFIETKIRLCEKYEKERLQSEVYKKLIERLELLAKQLESFFGKLDEIQGKLNDAVAQNATETNGIDGKIMYVYGSQEDKAATYKKLDLGLDKSNVRINKSVITAVYGSVCAQKKPSYPENSAYANIGVGTIFVKEIVDDFKRKIDENPDNRDAVDLDIYTALGSDGDAFRNCKDKLFRMSAPFLIYKKEISDNDQGTVTARTKTFWGFNPALNDSFSDVGAVLGINADIQADSAYGKNELCCYRAVYGLEAKFIPKLNECEDGIYYTCYSSVVNNMVEDFDGRYGERALVRTPHLDKTWHKILPYVTEEKQEKDKLGFFRGLWLAIAYGIVKTDKDGYLYLERTIDSGFGTSIKENVAIKYRGNNIGKTEVNKLIEALKQDKRFTGFEIPALEKRFKNELDDIVNYVSTDVIKGLTTKKDDLNPINLVCRYMETARCDVEIKGALMGALYIIADELVFAYSSERSKEARKVAAYKILRKIYDSSTRSKGKSEVFCDWEEKFKEYKINEETSAEDSSK